MKVLLTGFDPFGGEAVNPAQEAVQRVSDNINGANKNYNTYSSNKIS